MTVALSDSLPQPVYSATQVLENESVVAKQLGLTLYELMERAGTAVFEHIAHSFPQARSICVVCGKGNNGGDGYVIARLAVEKGWQVTLVMACESHQLRGEAKIAFEQLNISKLAIVNAFTHSFTEDYMQRHGFDCIVDCIFGIGFKGQIDGVYADCVHAINESRIPVISVDIPSGLNATTGACANLVVKATHTVTFIVLKSGMLTGCALEYIGHLFLADLRIGLHFQQRVTSDFIIQNRKAIPHRTKRGVSSHKGNIGLLLAVGGSIAMPGAIRLASEAALRSGAALVAVHCHPQNRLMVTNGRPELMLTNEKKGEVIDTKILSRAKAIVCGPGLGREQWGQKLFESVITQNVHLVLDADALHFLSLPKYNMCNNHWVLTPHEGEAAKLLGISREEVAQDRYGCVKKIATQYGGICVLKGAGSLISDGDTVWVNSSGNAGMASGGMGDVLSGTIAALLMQMPDNYEATRLAVYIHGRAADIIAAKNGQVGILASDLYSTIQYLLNEEV